MTKKTETFVFPSLAEYRALTTGGYNFKSDSNRGTWKSFFNSPENHQWHGIKPDRQGNESVADTMARLASGWQRGVDMLGEVKGVSTPMPTSIRRRAVWTDQGDEIDMQRVWSGNLETAWRRTRRVQHTGPRRVRIVVDGLDHGGQGSKNMTWRGVAALKLADALSAAGYLVEVESGFRGTTAAAKGDNVVVRVVVKPYDQPVNLSTLASTTALPGFFRFYGHLFHPIIADMFEGSNWGVGYGVTKLTAEHIEVPDTELLLVAGQDITNADDANAWLDKSMKAIEPDADALAA